MVKEEHKPLKEHRLISLICLAFLATSWLMYLLVSISLPIVKAIYLVRVYAITNVPVTSIATELRFGVWGVCASSAENPPNWYDNPGVCLGPQLGYEIPQSLTDLVGVPQDVVNIVLTTLLIVLILHPIAAALSLVTTVASLFLASHTMSIVALVGSIATSLLGSIVLVVDLVLIYGVRAKIGSLSNNGFAAAPGNALWMVLTAVILSWFSVIALSARACYCCGVRKHKKW
ncbi:hypothetical protein DL96DRAFT_1600874 [Flagelloscypha sp. PMI_526]|nr:hypothetical protein DL96DRAFT_1600874 [Flagelloscypha sp. PMI_526]